MKRLSTAALATLAAFGLAACSSETPSSPSMASSSVSVASSGNSYVLVARGNSLPVGLDAQVRAAGGTLTGKLDKVGIAFASSDRADFSAKLLAAAALQDVVRDTMVQWTSPKEQGIEAGDLTGSTAPSGNHIGSNEGFWPYQWAPVAVHAPEAWDAGARGNDVRVAVLDGGMNVTHIDLAGRVDVSAGHSFVPGQTFTSDSAGFSHATHVAGIIAAADNSIGTIGIAPGATIVPVKVLHHRSGSFSWVMSGIYYAATPVAAGGGGANIINMSLGATFKRTTQGARDNGTSALLNALSRATTYAYQQGVTVIASAGNEGVDLDHTANVVTVPAMSAHVIAIAATGPTNFFAADPQFDHPASYTNFGQSVIHFAAPGGDFTRYPAADYSFDMVLSPGSITGNGYFFAAGTSMAAPMTAGVAALILEKHPGYSPTQVERALEASADDLGKPGNDDFYGAGRVNAFRAIGQ